MSIPANPTTLSLAAHAARMAGLRNATINSFAVYTYAPNWFESVKTQLWQASTDDKLLQTTAVLLTAVGSRQLGNIPNDFDHEIRMRAFDGGVDDRGIFQVASTVHVQLWSNFSAVASDTLGRYVFTLNGTGAGQYRSIATYNDSTKFATFDSALTTAPTATTTALVAARWWDLDKKELIQGVQTNGKPERYRFIATTMEVEPPSDVIYPVLMFYGSNLTQLDDSSFTLINHFRQRYAYWLQGLKVEAMGQYDDDRFPAAFEIWQNMLRNYGGKNTQSDRVTFSR